MNLDRRNHPRPQFIRKDWVSLDGIWAFRFDDQNVGVGAGWFNGLKDTQAITVPFTYETELSGIGDQAHHDIVWYERTFEIETVENYALIFEGVDYECRVWLNGHLIGAHQGAYERFAFDLKNHLVIGENQVVVRVTDSLACDQPRGKQRWLKDNFGCWYVQTTGIWKSVWLEKQLSSLCLAGVKLTPDLDADQILMEPSLYDQYMGANDGYRFEAEVTFGGQLVSTYRGLLTHNMLAISLDTRLQEDACWGTRVWSPAQPNLYDVVFRLYDAADNLLDEVYSYFGMRKISIENGQVLLNNRQLYQRLILDQGYWEESSITPPSVEALELDVDRVLEMGYNGLRKHQKIEDERFMYLCDQKGLLVWVEMPSTYDFNDRAIENITNEWLQIVKQHYNHPCVITWVPFNESWGIKGIVNLKKPQQLTEGIYHLTKAIDSNRPVITNDGWEHTVSDILTLHDYEEFGQLFAERYADKGKIVNNEVMFNNEWFAFAEGYGYKGQPVIISEFGGIAFATDKEGNWGYGDQVQDAEQFMNRFEHIHHAIQDLPYVTGYCYTQLTDVEQEVNGLLDVDRKPKVEPTKVKEINERRTK